MKPSGRHSANAFAPMIRLGLYAFGVSFVWEMLQAPLFVGMLEMPRWDATALCLQAAFGDAVMIVIAFAVVALGTQDRMWMLRPRPASLGAFALLAALQGLALEWLSLRLERWSYGPAMFVEPLFGLGLTPILQWLILPLAILWAVRRRQLGLRTDASAG
jgi:hypothetical protein